MKIVNRKYAQYPTTNVPPKCRHCNDRGVVPRPAVAKDDIDDYPCPVKCAAWRELNPAIAVQKTP